MADPDAAEGAGHVVDEELQRLRDRCLRHGRQEVADLERGPAGVEAAAQRAGREAVDGGTAARLDVGEQVEAARDLGLERAGGDRGQVGLQQHVVDRAGQVGLEGRGRLAQVTRGHVTAARGQAAGTADAEHRRLGERGGDELAEDGGAARPQPADPLHERRHARPGGQHLALGHLGQHPQRQAPGLLGQAAGQLGGQGVPRLAGRVARAHQRRDPAARQPAADQSRPAPGDRQSRPHVELVGRQPRRGAVGHRGLGDQPGGQGDLDDQGGAGLVDVQLARDRLEVAHGQAAAAQHARRLDAPVVEQQLHPAYDVEGAARGAAGHECGVALRRGEVGHDVHRLGRGATAPQGQSHLAGEDDGGALTRHEETPADQLLGRRAGVAGRHGASRGAGRALAAMGVDVAQQGGRGGTQLGEPGLDVGGRSGLGAHRPQAAGRHRQAAHRVGHAAEGADAARGLPGERQVEQALQRCRRPGGVGVDDRDQLLRSGLPRNQQGIKHGELEPVQAVEGAVDRRTCGSPRGQLRGILRGGCGEIRSRSEQRHESLVGPATELVGKGACGCRPP